ncbi:MAG: MarR family transcriptional regulator [Rhizomicrobium sp.]
MAKAVSLKTTLEVRDACLCLAAQRAARALARRFDRAFRPLGLTNGQFSLLMALNRPQPAPMGDIARVLGLDRTTLTAALKPLIRRKLVAATPDTGDRRSRLVCLAWRGRRLLARAVPFWRIHHRALERQLRLSPQILRAALDTLSAPTRGAAGRD